MRRPLPVLAAVIATLLGGWLWFRDSSLAQVREVAITGVSSSEDHAVRAALESAARDMTTLHVRRDELRDAVARFPSVARLRVDADFPRRLSIEVIEREPVAVALLGGRRIPVSAAGLLMEGVRPADDLPAVRVRTTSLGGRVADRRALDGIAVLAAAPAALRERIERAVWQPRGWMLEVEDGPDVVFGRSEQARRKWAAAARVLAEPSALGAAYVDVRIPERVAAGGLQPAPEPTPDPQALPETTAPLDQ